MARYRAALAALAAVALLLATTVGADVVDPTLAGPGRQLQATPNINCRAFTTILDPNTPSLGCNSTEVALSSLVDSPAETTLLTPSNCTNLVEGSNCTFTATDKSTNETCQGSVLVTPCRPACALQGQVIQATSPNCKVTAKELGDKAFDYVSSTANVNVYLLSDLEHPMGTTYEDENYKNKTITVCMALTHRNATKGKPEVDGIADAPADACSSAFVWAKEAAEKRADGTIKARNWIYINDGNFQLLNATVGPDTFAIVSSSPVICIERRRIKRRGTTVAFKIGAADGNGFLDTPKEDVSGEVTIYKENTSGCKQAFDSLF
ncbi:hypothetical protein Rsub_02652 [Raphidocelis subcapitata]|uniref:Uncharacterized protein n=1 Tax=Raphidocelis subcapitata TaxID=307507 RepID=A0A2V0NQK1_9CHLO|nr:hypothetical protein Rsub_02652 [Raphidocelis subcapitata]|eukprot:GBF89948.1 hypothetical protein Rsub_02652 [Raphidocelis subcapitata]